MKTTHPPAPPTTASPEEACALAGRLLDEDRHREAAALLRPWREAHPGEPWDGLLARATLGRARELAAQGLYAEALLLWDEAAALLPEPPAIGERLLWLFNARRPGEATALFVAQGRRLRREQPRLLEAARPLIAALLLAGYAEVREALPENSPLHAQCATATAALEALCRGDDDARERIGAITPRSPYRHLRWILESFLLPARESKPIRALLKKVPADSPFAALAALARSRALDGPALAAHLLTLSDAVRPAAAALTGVTAQRLADLVRLTESASGAVLLERLMEPIARQADPAFEALARQCSLDLLPDHLDRQERFTARFGPLGDFEKYRLAALAQESQGNVPAARAYWVNALQALKKGRRGADTLLKSAQIHLRIAQIECHSHAPDQRVIRSHLESCLKLDPGERDALLWLIDRLAASGERALRQTWITRALAHHPKDVRLLTIALDAAEAAGAFKRAAGLARRILRLDPGNDAVRGMRIDAHLAHARKRLLGNRPDLARIELAKASRTEWHAPPNPAIPLLQGLAAFLAGEREAEREHLEQARRLLAHGGLYHLHLLRECRRLKLERTHPQGWADYLHGLTRWSQTLPEEPGPVAAMTDFLLDCLEADRSWVAEMLAHLEGYLRLGVDLAFDQGQSRRLCRLFHATGHLELEALHGEAAERRFPDDPGFLFHRLHGQSRGRVTHISRTDLPLLRQAAQAAWETGDDHSAGEIERFLAPRPDVPPLSPGLDAPSLLSRQRTARLVRELVRQIGEDYGDIRPTIGDRRLKALLLKQLQDTEFAAFGPFVLAHLIDRALAHDATGTPPKRPKAQEQLELNLDLDPTP